MSQPSKDDAREYIFDNLSEEQLAPRDNTNSSLLLGGIAGVGVVLYSYKLHRIPYFRKPWQLLAGATLGAIGSVTFHNAMENTREKLRRERRFFMEQKRSKFLGVREDKIKQLEERINQDPKKDDNTVTRGIVEYEWVEVDNDDDLLQSQKNKH
eukprot:gb/GECH01011991.1/.p1 GENE.gb/GECH01011991.1/~~gb/GECH01011991.1/.p1  ORF type:complete len:154 (+),score=30.48 gb/GECH01011991.1/:1-462(+)